MLHACGCTQVVGVDPKVSQEACLLHGAPIILRTSHADMQAPSMTMCYASGVPDGRVHVGC